MKSKSLFCLLGAALLVSLTTGCNGEKPKDKKENPSVKPEEKEKEKEGVLQTFVVDATDYTKWVYFSFEKGDIVATKDVREDFGEDDSWDIAFHRYDFRTNGGASGSHQGCVAETKETNIKKDIAIPAEDQFKKDEQGEVIVYFDLGEDGMHKVRRASLPLSYVLTTRRGFYGNEHEGAIISDGQMPPTVKLSKKVYFVRTAKGRLAKFKVTDYRDDHANTGFIKFEYILLPQK